MRFNSDYVIWVGSVFSDDMVLNNPAISPAGNKWQLNFINSLVDLGIRVINIGHCPERVFPLGKIFVNKRKTIPPDRIRLISSSYLNLPILRIIELNILCTIKLANQLRKEEKKPIYLIGYNTYSYNLLPLLYSKYIKKIKWISLVADPMFDNSNKINPFYHLSDAKVFFSYELFHSSSSKKKIHFDGGIAGIIDLDRTILEREERIILYTGAIERHTGVELLVEAFSLIKSSNIRLIICGKGNDQSLKVALKNNKKITFKGMVDKQELLSLYTSAYLFINPRLINEKTNRSNFPSKILEYLSFCKPIISTYTGGIHPAYKEVMQFIYSDNPQELAEKIDEVVSWENAVYLSNSEKIKEFVKMHKLWSKIVVDFNDWAEQI